MRVCATPGCPALTTRTYCNQHTPRGRQNRSPTTRAQNAAYHRERRRVLQGNPPCHWCGTPNATTADHLIAVANGGGHEGNMVPACPRCNYSRKDNTTWTPATH